MHYHQKQGTHALVIMVVMICLGLQAYAAGQANLGPVALATHGNTLHGGHVLPYILYLNVAKNTQTCLVERGLLPISSMNMFKQ